MAIELEENIIYKFNIEPKNGKRFVNIGGVKLESDDFISFKINKETTTIIKNNKEHIINSKKYAKDLVNNLRRKNGNRYLLKRNKDKEKEEYREFEGYYFVIKESYDFLNNKSRDIFMVDHAGHEYDLKLEPPYDEPELAQGKKYLFFGSEYRISFEEKAKKLIEKFHENLEKDKKIFYKNPKYDKYTKWYYYGKKNESISKNNSVDKVVNTKNDKPNKTKVELSNNTKNKKNDKPNKTKVELSNNTKSKKNDKPNKTKVELSNNTKNKKNTKSYGCYGLFNKINDNLRMSKGSPINH